MIQPQQKANEVGTKPNAANKKEGICQRIYLATNKKYHLSAKFRH